jgi:choline dehydrogenase-like flavoprotein
MLGDTNALPSDATLQADVCIAGAGAAGITLARELEGSGLRVLLLEGGELAKTNAMQALYEGDMLGIDTWKLDKARVRVLGGTTAHWGGWCRRLEPEDFEKRSWLANSGWPISASDLEPYYVRAHDTLQLGPVDYDTEARVKASKLPVWPLPLGIETTYFQFSPPTRFGKTYLPELEVATDVTLYLDANLVDIALEPGSARVAAFMCRTLAGGTFRVQANRYVLALGGLENARLLLASNGGKGVANENDVVGRYFMEHPHYYLALKAVTKSYPNVGFYRRHASDLRDGPDTRDVPIRACFKLSRELREREQLLGATATVEVARFEKASTGELAPSTVSALVGRDEEKAASLLALTLRCEQSPIPDSRITLGDELDVLGLPRLELDWQIAPEDQERLYKTACRFARSFASAGIARMYVPRRDGRFKFAVQPGGHHMGTTRMGADPATSVVDANCKAHAVDNLFIAGSSVFTTGGEANPTLTVVALAHRLAQHLKDAP